MCEQHVLFTMFDLACLVLSGDAGGRDWSIYMWTYIYIFFFHYTPMFAYISIYTPIFACVYIYIHIYIYTCTCTYTSSSSTSSSSSSPPISPETTHEMKLWE